MTVEGRQAGVAAMTIGRLARRTGATVKALRAYTDWGLIYTVGRSRTGYRLYDRDAEWCVAVIAELRDLGLTLAEIRTVLAPCPHGLGPALAPYLAASRERVQTRIAELERTRDRIDAFQAAHQDALSGDRAARLFLDDPRAQRRATTD